MTIRNAYPESRSLLVRLWGSIVTTPFSVVSALAGLSPSATRVRRALDALPSMRGFVLGGGVFGVRPRARFGSHSRSATEIRPETTNSISEGQVSAFWVTCRHILLLSLPFSVSVSEGGDFCGGINAGLTVLGAIQGALSLSLSRINTFALHETCFERQALSLQKNKSIVCHLITMYVAIHIYVYV